MPYDAPTRDNLVEAFPEFEATDPAAVTNALALAGRNVDSTWFEEDYQRGYMLYAAHLLSREEVAADSGGSGARIVSESLGPISVNYERNASAFDADVLGSTIYGQDYVRLLQLNRGGPRVV